MKLGPGEFNYKEDNNNAARSAARQLFFSYFEQLAPEAMKELEALTPGQGVTLGSLIEDIEAWANKYNLNEKWIIERALNSLFMWKEQPETTGHFCGQVVSLGAPPTIETFYFRAEEWKPEQQAWSEYEKYLEKCYQTMKAQYREQKESEAEKQGLQKAPEVRNKEHFAWLVRYQVKGWNYREIADDYSLQKDIILTDDNIGKGIKRAAGLIGLELRRAKKSGRPVNEEKHKQANW